MPGLHNIISMGFRWFGTVLTIAVLLGSPVSGAWGAQGPGPEIGGMPQVAATAPIDSAQRLAVLENYGRLPLHFVENQGQATQEVKYYAIGSGPGLSFTRDGLVITLAPAPRKTAPASPSRSLPGTENPTKAARAKKPGPVVRLIPLGLRPGVEISGADPLPGKGNYFSGNDPRNWRRDLPTFGAVLYREAYPGIDLKFYGNGREVEYDIIVKPGADPGRVRFRYAGVQRLEITREGDLAIHLAGGGLLKQKKPVVYQEIAGKRVAREGKFKLHGNKSQLAYGFELAAYDHKHPLIIDPVLAYSTYLGGLTNVSAGYALAVDGNGCAYVAGFTYSPSFPTVNPYQAGLAGNDDAFVTKFSRTGNTLIYSTYLGGSDFDEADGIAVDQQGCAYVTGTTSSTDFPVLNAYQDANQGGDDAFVTKLNPQGNGLVYSTYLGGGSTDGGNAITLNTAGEAYLTGRTSSTDFPTRDPYQEGLWGYYDAFISKLSADGQVLLYSTFLGRLWAESGTAIALDADNNIYVGGYTESANFPLVNPYQNIYGGGAEDAFVCKLSSNGQTLLYSTFLGGSGDDRVLGLAVDGDRRIYVTGYTDSDDFPIYRPYQATRAGKYSEDIFVTKFEIGGQTLVYSTYLGGLYADRGYAIAIDGQGQAYVTGETSSVNFPLTPDAFQSTYGGQTDAFLSKFSADGQTLKYSTFLGGGSYDSGRGIVVTGVDRVYLTGLTSSLNFPTKNAFQSTRHGNQDAFLVKFGAEANCAIFLLLD